MGGVCVCVRPGIQSEDQNQFFTFKVRTFWQSEVKISVLALWLCALSSLCHNMGVGGYGRNPLSVRARHVQRCVKKCPHFECVIHRFVPRFECRGRTHYTHLCILCPHFECRPGIGVCVCVSLSLSSFWKLVRGFLLFVIFVFFFFKIHSVHFNPFWDNHICFHCFLRKSFLTIF